MQDQLKTTVELAENKVVQNPSGTLATIASGDPAAIAALDAKYAATPLHDEHVKVREQYVADTPLREAILESNENIRQEDVTLINKFNADTNLRIEQRMNDLADIAKSEAASLIELYNTIQGNPIGEDKDNRIKVLVSKSPTYLASNSLRNLAQDLAQPDSSKPVDESIFAKELASEKSRYINAIKNITGASGLDNAIIDVLASDEDEATKFAKLKKLV